MPVNAGSAYKQAVDDSVPVEAEALIAQLRLQPLQPEGGWYRRTWASSEEMDAGLPCGSAIYFLITRDNFSALHKLPKDEVYHHYAGDPVQMLWLLPDGSGLQPLFGKDFARGQEPQLAVPAGYWQGSRVIEGGTHGWALLGATMAPSFAWEDYEHGEREALMKAYPDWREAIQQYTR